MMNVTDTLAVGCVCPYLLYSFSLWTQWAPIIVNTVITVCVARIKRWPWVWGQAGKIVSCDTVFSHLQLNPMSNRIDRPHT